MSGTSAMKPTRRGLAAFFAAVAASALCALMFVPAPASAATSVKAQLSLSGVASGDNPTGGSELGIHPGDSVVFSAATLPTAGLDKLGLGDLVGSLLSGLAKYQVTADFAGLPGGKKSTVLVGSSTKTFSFPKIGTYHFTWTAQSIGLLGVVPIQLDGNQLEQAGIKLNAKNQYIGTVVVAKNPPKGGISLQLPGVSVQPSLPIVGTLPKLSLPGLTTPTLPVSVPDLNPNKSKSSGSSTKSNKSSNSGTKAVLGALAIPAMVVPQGSDQVVGDTGSYPGASVDDTPVTGSSDLSIAPIPGTSHKSGSSSAKSASHQVTANSAGRDKTIDLASNSPSSSGLPVVLAMIAVLALVLVAGAYARLYLLRKQS